MNENDPPVDMLTQWICTLGEFFGLRSFRNI